MQTTSTPLRASLDDLARRLIDGAIDSQGNKAHLLRAMIRAQGWDSHALFTSGPLHGLSDEALLVLLDELAETIDGILGQHWTGADTAPHARDAARAELTAVLAGR